jgi:hypothetical protein
MADRVLFISWGASVRGRETRGLEVFNDTMGMYGRMQQDGRIESFDVALMNPSTGMDGYIQLHGSADQIAAIQNDEEFRRGLYDASLIVEDLKMAVGYTNAAIAHEMEMYQEAVQKVPQTA